MLSFISNIVMNPKSSKTGTRNNCKHSSKHITCFRSRTSKNNFFLLSCVSGYNYMSMGADPRLIYGSQHGNERYIFYLSWTMYFG